MLRKILLILSAILIVVSAVTFFFDVESARRILGAAMVSAALAGISFIIWETEGVHTRP